MREIKCFPSQRFSAHEINLKEATMNSLFQNEMVWREACPICQNVASEIKQLIAKDYRGFPCCAGECVKCGFVYSYQHLSSKALEFNYKTISTTNREIDTSNQEGRKNLFLRRVGSYAQERYEYITSFSPNPKLVVEVGCNDGANLYPFKQKGIATHGFDLDEDSLKVGRTFGLELSSGDCFDFFEKHKVDVVILSHFVEHLAEPKRFLQKLSETIGAETLVFIEVPGLRHPQWVNWKMGSHSFFQYEHLQYFDQNSLVELLHRSGFHVLKVDEFVRGIFKKGTKNLKLKENVGLKAFDYLYQTERRWETSWFRKVYTFLSNLRRIFAKR
jgi:2-polyprenyl-3-methyl-5-hydroxy-6-metoxy-1,4-benzoquinol methylase